VIPAAVRARFPLLRQIGAALVILVAVGFFLDYVNGFLQIRHWLFFRYAGYWGLSLLFTAACGASGYALFDRLDRRGFPLREELVLSFALGVLVFVVGWFLIGVAGALNAVSAIVWPILLLGLGLGFGHKRMLDVARKLRRAPATSSRRGLLFYAALAFGVLALGLVYLPIITPANLAFDSRFYHMAIAEHYAADGRIAMFREGWFMGAYPQLASYLYSWAFALPLALTFDKAEVASHLEFVLFLYTLATVPVLVRRLSPGSRMRLSWVAVFLFPELFCYDSLLSGAADHIAAIWCVPIWIALLRLFREFSARGGVVLGLMMGGAMLSKYSVWGMVIVPTLAVVVRALVLGFRRFRGRRELGQAWLVTPLVIAGVVLVATSPHWLKNLVWYHDPLYPLLHKYFPSRPWTPDNLLRFHTYIPAEWTAERSWKGVRETLFAALDFSLVPRDWAGFHRDVPIFGSLFTLALACLPFVRRRGRLLLLYAAASAAVMQWYWSFHQDRYLQSYVPWMAAVVAAVAVDLWRLGIFTRVAVAVAALAQIVWGGDVPFFPTHAMVGTSPHKVSIDFLSTGYRKDFKERFRPFGVWHDLDKALPRGTRVLLHDEHVHLGIGSPSISDFGAWQGGISYGRAPSPARVYQLLHGMEATHLLWPTRTSRAHDSLAADIAFFNFVTRYAGPAKAFGGFSLAPMPKSAPSDASFKNRALVLGCNDYYKNGVYRVSDLTIQPFPWPGPTKGFPEPREPAPAANAVEPLLKNLDAVVVNSACFKETTSLSQAGWSSAARRGSLDIWMPRRPR
jgi:hypothetical protein